MAFLHNISTGVYEMSFSLLSRKAQESLRERTEVLAVRITGFYERSGRLFIHGKSIPDGETVRISPPGFWDESYRKPLESLYNLNVEGAVVVFSNCELNKNDTYIPLKYSIVTDSPHKKYHLLHDQYVRITPLLTNKFQPGTYWQNLEWADISATQKVKADKDEMYDAILQVLQKHEFGTPGAILRGVDADGAAASIKIFRKKDTVNRTFLSPRDSLDRFLKRDTVHIHGIEQDINPNDFFDHAITYQNTTWEVFPIYAINLPSVREKYFDKSHDYRFSDLARDTGYMKSTVAFEIDSEGRYKFSTVVPSKGAPLPCSHIPTSVVSPKFNVDIDEVLEEPSQNGSLDDGISLDEMVASNDAPRANKNDKEPQVETVTEVQNVGKTPTKDSIDNHDKSNNSENTKPKRGRGRPPGSKNKKTIERERAANIESGNANSENSQPNQKGSHVSDNTSDEIDIRFVDVDVDNTVKTKIFDETQKPVKKESSSKNVSSKAPPSQTDENNADAIPSSVLDDDNAYDSISDGDLSPEELEEIAAAIAGNDTALENEEEDALSPFSASTR